MTAFLLMVGDALEQLRTLPDACVQTCVTSPPYWGLRDYGVEGQTSVFDDRCIDCHSDRMRAEGVAAERARVVAWLRAADSETLVWFAAQRIEQGWHDKEGE